MKLLQQMVKKKLERYSENVMNKKNDLWNGAQPSGLVRAYLRVTSKDEGKDKTLGIKHKLWIKFLKDSKNQKVILKLNNFYLSDDMIITNNFLREAQKEVEASVAIENLYIKGCVAVSSYEYD